MRIGNYADILLAEFKRLVAKHHLPPLLLPLSPPYRRKPRSWEKLTGTFDATKGWRGAHKFFKRPRSSGRR